MKRPLCECGCKRSVAWDKRQAGKLCRYADGQRCRERVYRAKLRADKERWEAYLAEQRRRQQGYREDRKHDPERYARHRVNQTRYERKRYAKLRSDPKLWESYLEEQRMRYALRQEQRGTKRRRGSGERVLQEESLPRLPAAPVGNWIASQAEKAWSSSATRPEAVCASLGVEPRSYFRWRTEESSEVQFDVVDRILVKGNACWWEIYDPDEWPEEYEKARAVFEPESVTA